MPHFFFTDPTTTVIYTLSLHDALPICCSFVLMSRLRSRDPRSLPPPECPGSSRRSEEHTSELQSRPHLVCRLLLEKKKKIINILMYANYWLLRYNRNTRIHNSRCQMLK